MKSYIIQPVDDSVREMLTRALRTLRPGGSEYCIDCGYNVANYYAKCRVCRERCEHVPAHGYIVIANGERQPKTFCLSCGVNMGGPKRGSTLLDVCWWDNTNPLPCERCGKREGVELHHWAPRNIFGYEDAETWPMSLLCRGCHHEWHRRMDGYEWKRRSA